MTKAQFLERLRTALHGLSDNDILGSLDFCAEMIDDRMEAGVAEAEAVAALGAPEDIAREIILDMPLPKIIKTKYKKRSAWRAWEIVLLVLGAPVWLPLLLTVAALLLTVYAILWTMVACLWSVDAALAAGALGFIVAGCVSGTGASLLLYVGLALAATGLAVLGFFGCLKMTVLFAKLSAKFGRWVKSLFVRRQARKETAI